MNPFTTTTTELPQQSCPYCGRNADCASDFVDGLICKPGDVTICIKCAGICVLDENMTQRKPLPGELERDPRQYRKVLGMQHVVQRFHDDRFRRETQPRIRYRDILWRRQR